MRRSLAVWLLASLVVLAQLGACGEQVDPDTAQLREADEALRERPSDPRAHEEVIRAAYRGVESRTDKVAGVIRKDARPFLDRAAAVWPRYVRVTRERPSASIASLMIRVYGDGLDRPREAAGAALFVTEERPSAESYVLLAQLYARARDRRQAKLAGQKALELADPSERRAVRQAIRGLLAGHREPGDGRRVCHPLPLLCLY